MAAGRKFFNNVTHWAEHTAEQTPTLITAGQHKLDLMEKEEKAAAITKLVGRDGRAEGTNTFKIYCMEISRTQLLNNKKATGEELLT